MPEALQDDQLVAGNAYLEFGTFLAILLGTIMLGIVIKYPIGQGLAIFLIVFFAISWLGKQLIRA